MLDEWAALDGKVAIITGGAGGLGLPITEALAGAGVAVAVCDRDPAAVAAVTERLAEIDADAVIECFDVRESSKLAAFVDLVDDKFGKLDILVNVPGGSFRKDAIDLTPNGVTAVIHQNFTHVLEASQLVARRMKAHGSGGSIITVSTVEAHRAMPEMAVYGAMKAAIEQLTRTLAVEWGPSGIRVKYCRTRPLPNRERRQVHLGTKGRRESARRSHHHPAGPEGNGSGSLGMCPVPGVGSLRLCHRHHASRRRRHVGSSRMDVLARWLRQHDPPTGN